MHAAWIQADFETKQPLGVVLERSKEWAIVKLANPELSQVSVGSALASVNGNQPWLLLTCRTKSCFFVLLGWLFLSFACFACVCFVLSLLWFRVCVCVVLYKNK